MDEQHDLWQFDCGVTSLNQWLSGRAREAQAPGTAATYEWTAAGTSQVMAYCAIAPHQVRRDEVSSAMAGGITMIPGYLLARLATDVALHGHGLGAELLHDAIDRIVTAADAVAGRLIVVDAIDDTAAAFYRHHDFQPARNNPHRLAIKVSTVRKAFGR